MNRKVEIFTAGCPVCDPVIKLVKDIARDSDGNFLDDITIYNLADKPEKAALDKMRDYKINRIPSVVVDGRLLDCCDRAITREDLIGAGIGRA